VYSTHTTLCDIICQLFAKLYEVCIKQPHIPVLLTTPLYINRTIVILTMTLSMCKLGHPLTKCHTPKNSYTIVFYPIILVNHGIQISSTLILQLVYRLNICAVLCSSLFVLYVLIGLTNVVSALQFTVLWWPPWYLQEEFEDTTDVIRIRKSKKERQYNGQKKKNKKINNDLQNIHIKLKLE
jgi:hypothetical protein